MALATVSIRGASPVLGIVTDLRRSRVVGVEKHRASSWVELREIVLSGRRHLRFPIESVMETERFSKKSAKIGMYAEFSCFPDANSGFWL